MNTAPAHPVTYALMVARACAELAMEAASLWNFPKPLAAAVSTAATDAAARLAEYLSSNAAAITPDMASIASHARADLEAVAQITNLVVKHELTPSDAACIAQSARYTADQAIKRLSHVEEAIDL